MSHPQNFAKLTELVRAQTIQLMEYGGTTPEATCDVIAQEEPDFCAAFGRDRVLKLCQVLHYSEVPEASSYLQESFGAFNMDYFGGRLPDYEVGVVYDTSFWGRNPCPSEPASGGVDFGLRIIFIAQMRDRLMIDALLHHMAHLAVGSDHHDERWIQEVARIQGLGAPFSIDPLA